MSTCLFEITATIVITDILKNMDGTICGHRLPRGYASEREVWVPLE